MFPQANSVGRDYIHPELPPSRGCFAAARGIHLSGGSRGIRCRERRYRTRRSERMGTMSIGRKRIGAVAGLAGLALTAMWAGAARGGDAAGGGTAGAEAGRLATRRVRL